MPRLEFQRIIGLRHLPVINPGVIFERNSAADLMLIEYFLRTLRQCRMLGVVPARHIGRGADAPHQAVKIKALDIVEHASLGAMPKKVLKTALSCMFL